MDIISENDEATESFGWARKDVFPYQMDFNATKTAFSQMEIDMMVLVNLTNTLGTILDLMGYYTLNVVNLLIVGRWVHLLPYILVLALYVFLWVGILYACYRMASWIRDLRPLDSRSEWALWAWKKHRYAKDLSDCIADPELAHIPMMEFGFTCCACPICAQHSILLQREFYLNNETLVKSTFCNRLVPLLTNEEEVVELTHVHSSRLIGWLEPGWPVFRVRTKPRTLRVCEGNMFIWIFLNFFLRPFGLPIPTNLDGFCEDVDVLRLRKLACKHLFASEAAYRAANRLNHLGAEDWETQRALQIMESTEHWRRSWHDNEWASKTKEHSIFLGFSGSRKRLLVPIAREQPESEASEDRGPEEPKGEGRVEPPPLNKPYPTDEETQQISPAVPAADHWIREPDRGTMMVEKCAMDFVLGLDGVQTKKEGEMDQTTLGDITVKESDEQTRRKMKVENSKGVLWFQSFGPRMITAANTDHVIKESFGVRLGVEPPPGSYIFKRGSAKIPLKVLFKETDNPKNIRIDIPRFDTDFSSHFQDELEMMEWMKSARPWAKMNPNSKRRVIELVEHALQNLGFKEAFVKAFVKGDEVLGKGKPRIITFVPSVAWVKTVLYINAVIQGIKGNGWSFRPLPDLEIYWASGMTQKQLSEAKTRAHKNWIEHGISYTFVCGDDNVSEDKSLDASKYDSTQRGGFLEAQTVIAERMGLSRKAIKLLLSFHRGEMVAGHRTYVKDRVTLPTGGPHTLFFNTLGMVIFAVVRHLYKKMPDCDSMKEAQETCGLEMTESAMPFVDSEDKMQRGHGVEFLKGVFLLAGEGFIWFPLPSRLCKAGKRICTVSRKMHLPKPESMMKQLSGVANSMDSYSLDPLLKTWVSVWKEEKVEAVHPDWVNIEGEKDLWTDDIYPRWMEWMISRYNTTENEILEARRQILEIGRNSAKFTGGLWDNLGTVDYAGKSPFP